MRNPCVGPIPGVLAGAPWCASCDVRGCPANKLQGYLSHNKKHLALGPYRSPMPRVLGGSWGGARFLMSEVPLYAARPLLVRTARLACAPCLVMAPNERLALKVAEFRAPASLLRRVTWFVGIEGSEPQTLNLCPLDGNGAERETAAALQLSGPRPVERGPGDHAAGATG